MRVKPKKSLRLRVQEALGDRVEVKYAAYPHQDSFLELRVPVLKKRTKGRWWWKREVNTETWEHLVYIRDKALCVWTTKWGDHLQKKLGPLGITVTLK